MKRSDLTERLLLPAQLSKHAKAVEQLESSRASRPDIQGVK